MIFEINKKQSRTLFRSRLFFRLALIVSSIIEPTMRPTEMMIFPINKIIRNHPFISYLSSETSNYICANNL